MRISEIINIDTQAGSEYLASSAHMGFWEVYTGLAKEYYSFEYPSEICVNPLDHEDLCDLVDDEVRSLRDFYSKFKSIHTSFLKRQKQLLNCINGWAYPMRCFDLPKKSRRKSHAFQITN